MTALTLLPSARLLRMGSRKERVLPVPVGAVTMMFLFSRRQGITCI